MAFKKIQELDCETTVALGGRNKLTGKANPISAEGYFLGTKVTASKKSTTGLANLHILQTPAGNVGVWGKTDLDRKMRNATAGHMVRITQNGTAPTPRGDMYKYLVEVDEENTIDVNFGTTASFQEQPTEDAYAPQVDEEETDVDVEEPAYDVIPAARASAPRTPIAAPNAASAARTQALLKSRTRTA